MLRKIYAVKDLVSNDFSSLNFFNTDLQAKRFFIDSLNSPDMQSSVYRNHPADFALVHIADFDVDLGRVATVAPSIVATFDDLLSFEAPPSLDSEEVSR